MTGAVVSLSDRRAARQKASACPGCTRDQLCYPHRLEALAHRLRDAESNSLLVPATVLADALEVIEGITRECLPTHARAMADTNNSNNSDRRAT